MADVSHRNTLFIVQCWLEGKKSQNAVYGSADFVDPFASPSPDRWANVVDGRNATLFKGFLQRQIEIWRIDTDENIRRIGQEAFLEIAPDPRNFPVVLEHFDIPTDREFFQRIPDIKALPLHFRPANAVEPRVGKACFEGLYEMARQQVAGRLAGNHGDAYDTAGGHRIMPRRETARKSRIG